MQNDAIIPMGMIVSAFGIRGVVRVKNYSNHLDWLKNTVYLAHGQSWQLVSIGSVQPQTKFCLVKLENIDDRDKAISLRGCLLGISRDSFDHLSDGEYYWCDLIGLSVLNQLGQLLGTVDHLMEVGSSSVLVVKHNTQSAFIPFVKQYIVAVDMSAKTITVDWEVGN